MRLVLCQVTRLASHHKLVEVTTGDVGRDHHDLLLAHDCLAERQDVRLLSQLVVDVDLAPDVLHQVLLDDLVHLHTLQHSYALGIYVTGHGHNSNHAASNEPADLILTDLCIDGFLLVLFGLFVLLVLLLRGMLLIIEDLPLILDLDGRSSILAAAIMDNFAKGCCVGRASDPKSVLLAELEGHEAVEVALAQRLDRRLGSYIGLRDVVLSHVHLLPL